jgi:hypothetical protein
MLGQQSLVFLANNPIKMKLSSMRTKLIYTNYLWSVYGDCILIHFDISTQKMVYLNPNGPQMALSLCFLSVEIRTVLRYTCLQQFN